MAKTRFVSLRPLSIVTVAVVVAGGMAAVTPAAHATPTAPKRHRVVWTAPARVNRTPVGVIPTGSWHPGARLSGSDTTATTPAATQVAAGSLGAQPLTAGSPAAGAGLGVQHFYGLETFGLDLVNNLQAQVNLSNGNLVVHSTDLKINGPGLSLRLDRFYNSRPPEAARSARTACSPPARTWGCRSARPT